MDSILLPLPSCAISHDKMLSLTRKQPIKLKYTKLLLFVVYPVHGDKKPYSTAGIFIEMHQ